MDKGNLERLRRKYANDAADETDDPAKKRLLTALFDNTGRRRFELKSASVYQIPFRDMNE